MGAVQVYGANGDVPLNTRSLVIQRSCTAIFFVPMQNTYTPETNMIIQFIKGLFE